MRFRYAFQKIVDLKASEKTQAEWELSHAVGKLQVEEQMLSGLHSEKSELQTNLSSVTQETVTVSDLMHYQTYLNHIDRRISQKDADVRSAQQRVNHERQQLTAKMVEEKVWTTARDKAKRLFVHAEQRKEQGAIDEMATMRSKRLSY
ncbi:MAG: flagellar export protein FliJ [Paenibacillaceae bacterium]|nr:flagellar export protein FliJ [Paenibacillaceae bacterium]